MFPKPPIKKMQSLKTPEEEEEEDEILVCIYIITLHRLLSPNSSIATEDPHCSQFRSIGIRTSSPGPS
ncbi:hypothetical protein, partial [Salmonella sp. SAL4457]|uniref:hypothetical protein n=1 Tax=Salmonella sp. SAL4457 TaxID=3159912 RepID=UPI00397B5A65